MACYRNTRLGQMMSQVWHMNMEYYKYLVVSLFTLGQMNKNMILFGEYIFFSSSGILRGFRISQTHWSWGQWLRWYNGRCITERGRRFDYSVHSVVVSWGTTLYRPCPSAGVWMCVSVEVSVVAVGVAAPSLSAPGLEVSSNKVQILRYLTVVEMLGIYTLLE